MLHRMECLLQDLWEANARETTQDKLEESLLRTAECSGKLPRITLSYLLRYLLVSGGP